MAEILGYKCPCCGGAVEFSTSEQKMKCPYCDTEFEIETLKKLIETDQQEDTDPKWKDENIHQSNEELREDGLSAYVCDNCGGEIVAEETMAASSCPFCGNPVIIAKQISGMLKPDIVIPFKLNKRAAEDKLREHLKGKFLLPKVFKSENRIKEVKGIYVPFWLYDCDADATIQCRATKVRRWESGDYEYTDTSYYRVIRSGEIGFEKVPVDGSKKMDDALMQSIEPYDYSESEDFETAYLSGFLADKYDMGAEECAPTANERMRQSTASAFMKTIRGYATCIPEHTNIHLKRGKITYALLPVWILNTQYKGKMYTFAMNGQTGKFVGNLPSDKKLAVQVGCSVFAAVTAVATLILALV